jgi:hypothetical protein
VTEIKHIYATLLLVVAVACATTASALSITPDKPQTASISLGAEFASGNYGTDTTTRSVYMPLTATWSPNDRFDIGIEVPFIYQSSSTVTTDLYTNTQSVTTAKTTARGGPGGNHGTVLQQQTGNASATGSGSSAAAVSGLGDIILRGGVIALFEGTHAPMIRPSLFIKCPTAKFSDGLGTGEFDFGVGVEASKWLGNTHLTGEGFYTYQGKADGFGLQNYFSYTAGIGYQLTKSIETMVLAKGATAPSIYSTDLLEVRARIIWQLTGTTSLDLFGSRGITDSSPEYGGGIAVIYSF